MENYINMKLDKQMIFNFARLRISNHSLEIETGRYKKKTLEQRLCKICNDDFIEDEMHFPMTCKPTDLKEVKFLRNSMHL